jgi:hypothetical protein
MEDNIKQRLITFLKHLGIGQGKFEKNTGIGNGTVNNIKDGISSPKLAKILERYPELNIEWLLTGEGEMLKKESVYTNPIESNTQKNRIPFYDDIITVGGFNDTVADLRPVMTPSEYIDTGDWFKEATAAIRHYGESMTEYPPGCILALKELKERHLVVWGRDYLIETNEYRVTKRVQRGQNDEYIKARSTNTETYPDGQPIHEHLDVAWKDINRIFLVLGYVVKKNGGTMVYNNNEK